MATPSLDTSLWQAAARSLDFADFASQALGLLGGKADLIVLRLARDSHTAELEVGPGSPRRWTLSASDWKELMSLAQDKPWIGQVAALTRRLPWLVPGTWHGQVAAIGIHEEDVSGLMLLATIQPGIDWLIRALVSPCAAVMANQQRWRALKSEREAAEAERRALLQRLKRPGVGESIVGAEAGLREVMEAVEQVAPSDAPVLILGETGTGKEVVARAVHTRSRRSKGPFLRVNCGAIPPELIDSELFGHERGSFTGATGARRGWFERADGGTLFLDEIGELPLAAQVRLLRVLQDGSFQRVGGEQNLSVDVRVVAATNRNLHAAVADGAFREDLWFRVAVFPIPLPPLRERLQDIPALAAHFSLRAAERLGLPPRMPDAEDLALLNTYPWPGNVRELASVIERAAILGDGHRLEVGRSLGVNRNPETVTLVPAAAAHLPASTSGTDLLTLEEINRRHITQVLLQCRGRVDGPFGAARRLKLNPNTLRSKMRKLGIPNGTGRDA